MNWQGDFDDFIQKLKAKVEKGLPGEEAQYRMAPAERIPIKEYLDNNPSPGKSSVTLLLYPGKSSPHSVLILRPSYKGVHSGQVCLPGGKFEESDPSLQHTAIRELGEEVGVDQSLVHVLGQLSQLYIPVSNSLVHPYILFTYEKPNFNTSKHEVEKLIEFKISSLLDPQFKKRKKIVFSKGMAIETPYYEIENNIVWGATAMILSEFEVILKRMRLPFLKLS